MPDHESVKHYSFEEDVYLLENGAVTDAITLAKALGRTPKSIRNRLNRLGLGSGESRLVTKVNFTKDETQYIKANYLVLTDAEMAAHLGWRTRQVNRFRLKHRWLRKNQRELMAMAEKQLGRPLSPGEMVSHIDGDSLNNVPENIFVAENIAAYRRLHATLEHIGFELYKRGMIKFDSETGRYTM